jgi:hypothetical protein
VDLVIDWLHIVVAHTGACDRETLVDVLIFLAIGVLGSNRSRETAVEHVRAESSEMAAVVRQGSAMRERKR